MMKKALLVVTLGSLLAGAGCAHNAESSKVKAAEDAQEAKVEAAEDAQKSKEKAAEDTQKAKEKAADAAAEEAREKDKK